MTNTFDTLLNPLSSAKAETLARLHPVLGPLPMVLLGAFARDLIFYHLHNIEPVRVTKDIDISVQMASWGDFKVACDGLKGLGFKNMDSKHPEKWTDQENGQEVDLLPFGCLSEDGKTITWPEDDVSWTITGIQEAYAHAWGFRLDSRDIRVIPPCALIALKIFATYDRPDDRKKKDAGDIHFVLNHYLTVGGSERLRSGGK